MVDAKHNLLSTRKSTLMLYAVSVCGVIGLMVFAAYLSPTPVEETVTVEADEPKSPELIPVVNQRVLVRLDPNIETAGDRVAAACIYLRRHQTEPALTALQEAQLADGLAVEKAPNGSKVRDELLATNREIERVKELIRKGKIAAAARELRHIDQALDGLSN